MEFDGRSRISLQLNLAPLIDVMLLLLIFFMLTSTFIVAEAIDIDLPFSKSGVETERHEIVVLLGKNGRVAVNDELIEHDALEAKIAGLLERDPAQPITLRTDAEVSVQEMLIVMDAIRRAGGTRISIATDRDARRARER